MWFGRFLQQLRRERPTTTARTAVARMPEVASITPWKDQVAPMAWRNGRVYYQRTGAGVVADGFSCLPDGTDERIETGLPDYPATTHAGIADVSPDGQLALVTVERSNHWPNADGYGAAAPGAGTYNDLWLLEFETGRTWKMVDLLVTKNASLIWPRFDQTGTRVAWTELYAVQWWDLGKWALNVAEISWNNGTPSLTRRRVLKAPGFVEPYEFVGDKILATASLPGLHSLNPQIVTYPVTASAIGSPTRLSPKTPNEAWVWFENYNEFAYTMPAFPDRIMFGRTWQADNGSIEFWTMPKTGGPAERLTYMSKPGHVQYQNDVVIVGGIAWDPDNPSRFVAGYGSESGGMSNNYRSVMVELA